MAAAAAARKWWAARGRRASAADSPRRNSAPRAGRRASPFMCRVVLAGATLFCAAIGFAATQFSETHVEAEQRAALRAALDEFQRITATSKASMTADLREIQRRAGLQDLRFDARSGRRSRPPDAIAA